MKTFLFILLFSTSCYAIEPPNWWIASRGYVKKAKQELHEFDKRLTEVDQELLANQKEFKNLLETHEDFTGRLGRLEALLDYTEDEIKENADIVDVKIKDIKESYEKGNNTGAFIKNLYRSVTTGDPTAIYATLMTGLSMVGIGYGKKKSNDSKKKEAEAQKYRSKCLVYGTMGEESKDKIKSDSDFPEIN